MGEKRDMLEYKIATAGDIDLLMESRLEMLKEVNDLAEDHCYDEAFVAESRRYFLEGNHKTVLVVDGKRVVACATLCYLQATESRLKASQRRLTRSRRPAPYPSI